MPARIVAQNVKDVLRVVSAAEVLTLEIDAAHQFTEAYLQGKGLSEDLLKQIELFLACHFVALGIPQANRVSSDVDGVEERYGGDFAVGLSTTRWGQQAILFDTSGTLAAMAKGAPKVAQLRVV